MTWRNLLLRAYPRAWRGEYGEELAGILARKRLSVSVVADVLGNGARQRLYLDEPWKICGAGLFAWTCLWVFVGPRASYPWNVGVLAAAMGTGARTVLRGNCGEWEASAASVKAVLAGVLPAVLAVVWRALAHDHYSVQALWPPRTSLNFFPWAVAAGLVESALFGLAGAMLGRFAAGFREGVREP
jgi:hypothetical protein